MILLLAKHCDILKHSGVCSYKLVVLQTINKLCIQCTCRCYHVCTHVHTKVPLDILQYCTVVVCHYQVYENEVKRRFKKELCFGVKVLKIFNV